MLGSVVIVGGGLAGIAAAVRLSEAGVRVHLIEAGATLGGRAVSLAGVGPIITGGATNFLDLLDRLDLFDSVVWMDALPLHAEHRERRMIAAGRWPAPLHAKRVFRDSAPSPESQREVKQAFRRLLRLSPTDRLHLRSESLRSWLEGIGQSAATIQSVWRLWCDVLLQESPDDASAAHFVQVVQEGILPQRFGAAFGEWILPETQCRERVRTRLEANGGSLRLSTEVRALTYDGRRITGIVTQHESIDATSTIVAVAPDVLTSLATRTLQQADQRLQRMAQIDRRLWHAVSMTLPLRVLKDGRILCADDDVRWFVDAEPWREEGQRLTLVFAVGAIAEDDQEADVITRARTALDRLLPHARGLEPTDIYVYRQIRTTRALDRSGDVFRPFAAPGTVGSRGGGPPNLYLAGDWTEADWPSSVESAVRSGYAVAGAILGKDLLVGTLPPTLLGRLLGLRSGGNVAH